MDNIQREKIETLSNINSLMLKERSYLNVIRGFCENESSNSEQIADLCEFISHICTLHEELIDVVDNAVIKFVSIVDRK